MKNSEIKYSRYISNISSINLLEHGIRKDMLSHLKNFAIDFVGLLLIFCRLSCDRLVNPLAARVSGAQCDKNMMHGWQNKKHH